MRFLRRSLVGLFLISVTIGILALAGEVLWQSVQARLSDAPPARRGAERVYAVNVVTIRPEEIEPVLKVYGEVRAARTLEIRATSSGRVTYLAPEFAEGGAVEAGQLLVGIDPATAESDLRVAQSDLSEAEAELADAERAIELARDDLAAAEAQKTLRDQALERTRNAKDRGIGTDTAVEEAELAAASAGQSVLSKRSALAQAQSRIELARTRLDRQKILVAEAERAVADTEIRAAFSGTLSEITLVQGRLVSNNESLGQLTDPSTLEVSFRLSAAEYARLLGGDGKLLPANVSVSLGVSGADDAVTGAIARESAAVGEGQTGRLLFARLDAPGALRPGDFVEVGIRELPLQDVARLPATAVGADGTVLAVGDGERLVRLPAEVVRRQGDDVLIAAEALAGRQVVAQLTPLLGAGIRVRPLEQAEVGAEAAPAVPETIELTEERRARLVAFIEANERMPAEAKQRVLAQLQEVSVPAEVVQRIESRMGG